MTQDHRDRRRFRIGYERRIVLLAAAAVVPWAILAAVMLLTRPMPTDVRWALITICTLCSVVAILTLRSALSYPLRTLSNVLASIREEDYSFRIRGARSNDALGEVMREINALGTNLREQRLEAREATALVRTVIRELDAAIFAFDGDTRLKLVNRAGAALLARNEDDLAGKTADELGLAGMLEAEDRQTIEANFPGGAGRWSVRLSTFREGGRAHRLLVITDLSRPLREEERQAWQRLLRVIGHELNNSLAPIQSIAASLETISQREPLPEDFRDDLQRGLRIIGSRAQGLNRFTEAYSRLARLPQPRLTEIDLRAILERVVALESDQRVKLIADEDVVIEADPDQIEQALINLIRNAIEASAETGGGVTVSWRCDTSNVHILILDEGSGITGRTSLFIPFFTTKPGGTGIGLVLSRQIVEAHRGTLVLENRTGGRGCEARLTLPRTAGSRRSVTQASQDSRVRS